MKQMILWCLVAGLLGFAPQLLGASDLIEQAEAQALCNPHLKNSLNCTKKKRTTVNPKPKKPVVCVDDKVSSCLRTLDQGLREVADGGTVVVRPGLVHKRNIVISRPVVLCVGNTTTKRCSKAADILGRDIEVKGRTVPVNVFIIRPNDETKPCIDIRPRADSEVVISGVHVVASSKYRAGECVWQKSGTLRLMWSDLLGENTAVGMLALTGKSAHIEGNFIEGGQNGIKIFPPDPGTFVLLNNDVSHATTGIRVQGGSNVFGIGNKVHDNSGDGIVGLEGDAFYARNEVIHNRGSGLRFDRDRLTHSLPRTEAEVIGNTLDWNGRGEIRAEGEVVVVSAVNCVVVKNKSDYRKHMRRYTKQQNMREYSNRTDEPGNPSTKVPLGYSKDKNETGSLYVPVENIYWLETWGMFPSGTETCEKIRGKTWKKRCVQYVQFCTPQN